MEFECANAAQLRNEDVALAMHRSGLGRHIGFAVFTPAGKREFLHLAWHRKVRRGPYPPEHCSIVGPLPFDRISMMTLKKALWNIGSKVDKNAKAIQIPYGVNIDPSKGAFDRDGNYKPPSGRDGLTCATFVSEVCRGVGLRLLDEATWTAREEDSEWIEEICRALSHPDSGADEAHVRHVRASFNGVRIRPEEVAASAALWDGKPAGFGSVEEQGKALIAKLQACCPPTSPPSPAGDGRASPEEALRHAATAKPAEPITSSRETD
jgi:hypothetical protein